MSQQVILQPRLFKKKKKKVEGEKEEEEEETNGGKFFASLLSLCNWTHARLALYSQMEQNVKLSIPICASHKPEALTDDTSTSVKM